MALLKLTSHTYKRTSFPGWPGRNESFMCGPKRNPFAFFCPIYSYLSAGFSPIRPQLQLWFSVCRSTCAALSILGYVYEVINMPQHHIFYLSATHSIGLLSTGQTNACPIVPIGWSLIDLRLSESNDWERHCSVARLLLGHYIQLQWRYFSKLARTGSDRRRVGGMEEAVFAKEAKHGERGPMNRER